MKASELPSFFLWTQKKEIVLISFSCYSSKDAWISKDSASGAVSPKMLS